MRAPRQGWVWMPKRVFSVSRNWLVAHSCSSENSSLRCAW